MKGVKGLKGQAAIEFLMTYGWAILAAVSVFAVLAIYFNPGSVVGNVVLVASPLKGVAQTLNSTSFKLEVRNDGGEKVTVTSFYLNFVSPSGASCAPLQENYSIEDQSSIILESTNCTGLKANERYIADLTVRYRMFGSNLDKTTTGTLNGRVIN